MIQALLRIERVVEFVMYSNKSAHLIRVKSNYNTHARMRTHAHRGPISDAAKDTNYINTGFEHVLK